MLIIVAHIKVLGYQLRGNIDPSIFCHLSEPELRGPQTKQRSPDLHLPATSSSSGSTLASPPSGTCSEDLTGST